MALITSTQTGDWDTAGTWVGGVAPVTGDGVVIATTHVVTKNSAANATNDCITCVVTGTLAIAASNGLRVGNGNGLSGAGKLTMLANSNLYVKGIASANTIEWDCQGTDASNMALIDAESSGNMWMDFATPAIFRWTKFDQSGTSNGVLVNNWGPDSIVEDCDFDGSTYVVWPYTGSKNARMKRCYIYGGTNGLYVSQHGGVFVADECHFGVTRSGADNNTADIWTTAPEVELLNCELASTTPIKTNVGGAYPGRIRAQGHQQVEGDWLIENPYGRSFKSTASKNANTYGTEVLTKSGCDVDDPYFIDYLIPIATGDTVAPTITVKNVTADLNLQDTNGLIDFELDPGDEWGLNQVIDGDTLSDIYLNFRTVTFTGAAAGGTAKKGTVLLRVSIRKYVASAVVYLADFKANIT